MLFTFSEVKDNNSFSIHQNFCRKMISGTVPMIGLHSCPFMRDYDYSNLSLKHKMPNTGLMQNVTYII